MDHGPVFGRYVEANDANPLGSALSHLSLYIDIPDHFYFQVFRVINIAEQQWWDKLDDKI